MDKLSHVQQSVGWNHLSIPKYQRLNRWNLGQEKQPVKAILIRSQHTWWRHQMETFSALLAICAGNSPVPGEFPAQRPVTRSFDVVFDLRLNKRLRKQSWGWWFETLSRPLWRHRNDNFNLVKIQCLIKSIILVQSIHFIIGQCSYMTQLVFE